MRHILFALPEVSPLAITSFFQNNKTQNCNHYLDKHHQTSNYTGY